MKIRMNGRGMEGEGIRFRDLILRQEKRRREKRVSRSRRRIWRNRKGREEWKDENKCDKV